MKYEVGDKVRIKSLDWYNKNKDITGDILYKSGPRFASYMKKYCGQTMTIRYVYSDAYRMEEDSSAYESGHFWTDEMIEGLVEDEIKPCTNINDMKNDVTTVPISAIVEMVKKLGFSCPNGYIFKDENNNIINTQRIILEKKKAEYPDSYEECCKVLNTTPQEKFQFDFEPYGEELYNLHRLLICRDAYLKIAGEELGLGKPWKPNLIHGLAYTIQNNRNEIGKSYSAHGNKVLMFPTIEMRDAFMDNFDTDIEFCKELL